MTDTSASHSATHETLLATIVDACLSDIHGQHAPRVEEYLAQYPELAEDLEAILPALCTLGELEEAAESGESQDAPAAPIDPVVSQAQLGDYVIRREIGRGGMGVVYEALQVSLNRPVALKVLPFASVVDPRDIQRFKNEAQIAAHIHHPHVVPVYAVGCENGVHYYAMQLIEGHTVAQLIWQLSQSASAEELGEPLVSTCLTLLTKTEKERYRTIARLGIQAAEALHCAHSLGLVHRDVKPSNLLIDGHGKLWVSDFGLAKIGSGSPLTQSADLIGTIAYMSPEQTGGVASMIDHRSDIYALGATLYELAGLERMFTSENRIGLLRQVATSEPRPLRQVNRCVPIDLETIIHKALAKLPNERYATARELADDLQRFLDAKPIRARRASLMDRTGKWLQRHRMLVLWLAAMLVMTTVGSLVAAGLVYRAKKDTDAALADARHQKSQADSALNRERAAVIEAQEQSQVAREAVDDMYSELVSEWMWDSPHRSRVQEEFMLKALAYYKRFCAEHEEDDSAAFGLATVLWQMGVIQHGLNQYGQAHEQYTMSIKQLEELRAGDPESLVYGERLSRVYLADAAALHKLRQLEEMSDKLSKSDALVAAMSPQHAPLGNIRLRSDSLWGAYWLASGASEPAEKRLRAALQRERPAIAGEPNFERSELLVEICSQLAEIEISRVRPRLALEYLEQGRAYLQSAQRRGAGSWPVRKMLRDLAILQGIAYSQLSQPKEALRVAYVANEISLGLLADFPEVPLYAAFVAEDHIALARLHLHLGEHEKAMKLLPPANDLLEQLVGHHPESLEYRRDQANVQLCFGHVFAELGQWDNAAQSFEKAMRAGDQVLADAPHTPAFTIPRFQYLLEYARFLVLVPDEAHRNARLSESLARQAIALMPAERDGYRALGMALYRQGAYKDAVEQLKRTDPDKGTRRMDTRLLLALAYHQLGDDEEARAQYEKALVVASHPGERRDALAVALFREVERTLDISA